MKKYYLFIIIILAVSVVMFASCKNNKRAETNEDTAEVVETAKKILADDVLATIDEFGEIYIDECGNFDIQEFIASNLTDEEKMIKPDYLLDPAQTRSLVTKSQKFAALAILVSERTIRTAYDMPKEETVEAIIHLAADLNYPLHYEELKDLKTSEKIRRLYEVCKAKGELTYFWQLNSAFMTEFLYLIVCNPELFLNNLTDEQWSSFKKRYDSFLHTVRVLADYDEEMASVMNIINETNCVSSDEEASDIFATKESGIQKILESKDKYITRRNALLK